MLRDLPAFPDPSFSFLQKQTTAAVSSSLPSTKGEFLLLFPICGWFRLFCPPWSSREQKQGRIWRIGLSLKRRHPRCFGTLATPAPQTDPSAAALHYQINLFRGPQSHVTKNPTDALKSSWTFYIFIYLSCISKLYLMHLFMDLKIVCSIFLPHNPTPIENGIFFLSTAQFKLPTIACKNVKVVF